MSVLYNKLVYVTASRFAHNVTILLVKIDDDDGERRVAKYIEMHGRNTIRVQFIFMIVSLYSTGDNVINISSSNTKLVHGWLVE